MRYFAPLDNEPKPGLLEIEVATSFQIPSFHIIGLPAPEVSEARERIRAAIENSDLEFPRRRLVVNLSPASVRKRGTGLDLAIALAIIDKRGASSEQAAYDSVVACGELSLDGKVRSAGGVTRTVYAAWDNGAKAVLLPREDLCNARQAVALIAKGSHFASAPPLLLSISTLAEAWEAVLGKEPAYEQEHAIATEIPRAQFHHDRAPGTLLPLPALLERVVIAASAGFHHLILLGPKGSGKSYAMAWMEALQPDRTPELQLQHELLIELKSLEPKPIEPRPPIRRVNPQSRPFHLIGSGKSQGIKPGEFSLAHGGLLIADEFPAWPRDSRESLRIPLETGSITIPGMTRPGELPARFLFAATGNLCPCGGWPRSVPIPETSAIPGAPVPSVCVCSPLKRSQYRDKLSGPVLDRVDLAALSMCAPPLHATSRENVNDVRSRVEQIRTVLMRRWGRLPGSLTATETEDILSDHPEWSRCVAAARVASLRSRHKVIRVALTLAAVDQEELPSPAHFAEAAFYRPEALQA